MVVNLEERVWKDHRTGKRVFCEETEDAFRVHGVKYRGKARTIEFSKEPLDKENPRTQEDWLKYVKDTSWLLPDAQAVYGIYRALSVCRGPVQRENWNKEENIGGKASYVLELSKGVHPMITSTTIRAQPGNSLIEHGRGELMFTKRLAFGYPNLIKPLLGAERQEEVYHSLWNVMHCAFWHKGFVEYHGFPLKDSTENKDYVVGFWFDSVSALPQITKGVAHGIRFV